MTSRGAWPYWYEKGLDYRGAPNGRGAYGIYAFKKELIYNGFTGAIDTNMAYWGDSAVKQTIAAQKHFMLVADGVLGPTTARCLFRLRTLMAEKAEGIPQGLLQQIKTLESSNDPVAQGVVDPHDEGLMQENTQFNTTITVHQMWAPNFIIPYAAKQLVGHYNDVGKEWKAATAAWNVGEFYANQWRAAGYPVTGGPLIDNEDLWITCTHYVALVDSMPL